MKMIKKIVYSSLFILFGITIYAYYMGIMPVSYKFHSKYYSSSQIFMDGYDIVNYHIKSTHIKGNVNFRYEHDDIVWYFSSKKNLKRFTANPKRYVPQFGGYCTYYISKGFTFSSDPKAWHLSEGKIYFFKDQDTKENALEDWKNIINKATEKWQY